MTDVKASDPSNVTGYRSFELGSFKFRRDEYFVNITWKTKDAVQRIQPMSP